MIVYGDTGNQVVTGRLLATNLTQGVEVLCFLLGTKFRKVGEDIYLVGGSAAKVIRQFPSHGLDLTQLGALREGVSLLADQIVVETDQVRANQIGEVVGSLGNRRSLTLEVFMLESGVQDVERINAWLDQLKMGAGYFANSAVPYAGAAQAAGGVVSSIINPDANRKRGFSGMFDGQILLDFVRDNTSIKVQLREQIQVLSGGKSRFQSGEVVEDQTYTSVGTTTGQVVSSINRRTVGLEMDVDATFSGTNWFLKVRLQDSTMSATGGRELETRYEGERVLTEKEPYFLLASFTRDSKEEIRESIPLLTKLPLIGKVFRKGQNTHEKRQVTVLARPILLGGVQ